MRSREVKFTSKVSADSHPGQWKGEILIFPGVGWEKETTFFLIEMKTKDSVQGTQKSTTFVGQQLVPAVRRIQILPLHLGYVRFGRIHPKIEKHIYPI